MKRLLILSISIGILSVFVFSCRNKKEAFLFKSELEAILNAQSEMIGYGQADLGRIIDKSDINAIPELNEIFQQQFAPFLNTLDLEEKVFFTLKGPFEDRKANETALYFKVKNVEELKESLSKLGVPLKEDNDYFFSRNEKFSLGFNHNLLVVIFTNQAFSSTNQIRDYFKINKEGTSHFTIDRVYNSNADLDFQVNLNQLISQNDTVKQIVFKDGQLNLLKLFQEESVQFSLNFEEDKIVGSMDFLIKNEELATLLPFKKKTEKTTTNSFVSDDDFLTLQMSLDMMKVEELALKVMDRNQFFKPFGLPGKIVKAMVGDTLYKISNGEISITYNNQGTINLMNSLTIPKANYFMELGENGAQLVEALESLVNLGLINKTRDSLFQFSGLKFQVNDKQLNVYAEEKSSITTVTNSGIHQNEHPFYLFINLQKGKVSRGKSIVPPRIQKLSQDVTVIGGNSGFEFELNLLPTNENALKKMIQEYKNELKASVSK